MILARNILILLGSIISLGFLIVSVSITTRINDKIKMTKKANQKVNKIDIINLIIATIFQCILIILFIYLGKQYYTVL